MSDAPLTELERLLLSQFNPEHFRIFLQRWDSVRAEAALLDMGWEMLPHSFGCERMDDETWCFSASVGCKQFAETTDWYVDLNLRRESLEALPYDVLSQAYEDFIPIEDGLDRFGQYLIAEAQGAFSRPTPTTPEELTLLAGELYRNTCPLQAAYRAVPDDIRAAFDRVHAQFFNGHHSPTDEASWPAPFGFFYERVRGAHDQMRTGLRVNAPTLRTHLIALLEAWAMPIEDQDDILQVTAQLREMLTDVVVRPATITRLPMRWPDSPELSDYIDAHIDEYKKAYTKKYSQGGHMESPA